MEFLRRLGWRGTGDLIDEGLALGEGGRPQTPFGGSRLNDLPQMAPSQDGEPLVRTEGLTKRYPPGVTALDEAALTIDRGEFLAIMGRSGSGKSTLLHLLGCLDRPTAGSVWRASSGSTTGASRWSCSTAR